MRHIARTKTAWQPWLVGLAAAGLVLATGCTAPAVPSGATNWVRTEPSPLGFVNYPLTVWVDGVFLVIGGSAELIDDPKPRNRTAGSRFDPALGTWTTIAPAPVGLSQFDAHVVLGGVLYVVVTEEKEATKSSGNGPWACDRQGFYSYDLATNAWAELPLPAGVCSLDPSGMVATSDAIALLSTGNQVSSGEGEIRWSPRYPRAVDAVFDPARKAWTLAKAPAQRDTFRWGTWTEAGLLVAVEPLAPPGAYTDSSPATPAVYSWDYRTDSWQRLDRSGSDSLDWKKWTGRIQESSGPIYFQEGELLVFDAASGTFKRKQARCGTDGCDALMAGFGSRFGSGVAELGVFADGWTLTGSGSSAEVGYLLRPATGETKALSLPKSPDPKRLALDSVALAGGAGVALSCPIAPRRLPEAKFVEDIGGTIAPLTLNGNAGTGQPGAMIRVTLTAPNEPGPTLEELAVGADGTWQFVDTASRPTQLKAQSVEYVHKQDMQAYCYLLRY